MAALRRYLWTGALLFGLIFIGAGAVFVVAGQNTKNMIIAGLQEENVKTGADGEKFGVPTGSAVVDARTAQAQSDTIKLHSTTMKPEAMKDGKARTLSYADMKVDLFVDKAAYDAARANYLNGLNLRNALTIAIMAFGVTDLVMGIGAIVVLLGLATLIIAAPALYWAREAEAEVEAEVLRRLKLANTPAAS